MTSLRLLALRLQFSLPYFKRFSECPSYQCLPSSYLSRIPTSPKCFSVGSCNFKLQYINSIFSHALFTATHPVAEEFFQKAKLLNQYLGLYWHNILTFSVGNTIISSAEGTTNSILEKYFKGLFI